MWLDHFQYEGHHHYFQFKRQNLYLFRCLISYQEILCCLIWDLIIWKLPTMKQLLMIWSDKLIQILILCSWWRGIISFSFFVAKKNTIVPSPLLSNDKPSIFCLTEPPVEFCHHVCKLFLFHDTHNITCSSATHTLN